MDLESNPGHSKEIETESAARTQNHISAAEIEAHEARRLGPESITVHTPRIRYGVEVGTRQVNTFTVTWDTDEGELCKAMRRDGLLRDQELHLILASVRPERRTRIRAHYTLCILAYLDVFQI